MTIDRGLLELMTDTVTWSTGSTVDQYGVPAWSTGTHTMRARITYKHHEMRDRTGRSIEARGIMWCANDSTHATTGFVPRMEDRVSLPDGTTPPIITVETYYDENFRHHHRVTFGY
jgi:hypothetical protein